MLPLSDNRPSGIFPFWVIVIIAINLYVFYLELTTGNPDLFVSQYALIPANINLSNLQTLTPLITSQFLHGGFLHIISNMLYFWVFGDNIEAQFGKLFFPIFYLGCGVLAGFCQYLFFPHSVVPMIGASGAVAGVLGAYFAYFPSSKVKALVPIFGFFTITDLPASLMLLFWFFMQLFSGTFAVTQSVSNLGGIAYFAHIGGFIAGFLIAKLFPQKTEVLEPINN